MMMPKTDCQRLKKYNPSVECINDLGFGLKCNPQRTLIALTLAQKFHLLTFTVEYLVRSFPLSPTRNDVANHFFFITHRANYQKNTSQQMRQHQRQRTQMEQIDLIFRDETQTPWTHRDRTKRFSPSVFTR